MFSTHTENQNQTSFYPFAPREISVLTELIFGHLRCLVEDVPPQPNSPPKSVGHAAPATEATVDTKRGRNGPRSLTPEVKQD